MIAPIPDSSPVLVANPPRPHEGSPVNKPDHRKRLFQDSDALTPDEELKDAMRSEMLLTTVCYYLT